MVAKVVIVVETMEAMMVVATDTKGGVQGVGC